MLFTNGYYCQRLSNMTASDIPILQVYTSYLHMKRWLNSFTWITHNSSLQDNINQPFGGHRSNLNELLSENDGESKQEQF